MPVRVLDSLDEGTSSAIARGIRYSVDHDARVINLSVEFFDLLSGRPYTITSSPDVRDAIRYAGEHRVPVVVAAGNSGEAEIPSTVLNDSIIYVGAATPRSRMTPTARPAPRRGATSSRSASSTASTATSRSRAIAAGASG
jgi:FAD/FMN-containing dehydrogenase